MESIIFVIAITSTSLLVASGILRRNYLAAQAGVMADALAEGEPCPVCGSLEHPAPAAHVDAAPTLEQVKRAEAALRHFDRFTRIIPSWYTGAYRDQLATNSPQES